MASLVSAVIVVVMGCIVFWIFWSHAPKFYEFHRGLRQTNPVIFKMIGFNEKWLSNPDLWIKHFRFYVAIVVLLISAIFLTFLFESSAQ